MDWFGLQAVAENHQSRQKQRLQATASAGGQKQMPEGAGKHQQPQQEPGQQQQGQQQQLSQLQQGKQLQQQKQPQQHRDPAVPIFEQPKKLKQRKKDYLNAKKLKKKKGKKGTEETMHEKERQLVDKVRFGETVHQPLKVHLKRKHWDEAAAQKAEHERCKRVFLSQMNMAQQQQQQAGGKGGGKPAASKVQNEDNSQLRAEVIEAYRSRRKQPAEGRATLGTLKHLVK